MWAGLGGGTSASDVLYQVGTKSSCVNGTPKYTAWYEEYYPGGPAEQPIKDVTNADGEAVPIDLIAGEEVEGGVSLGALGFTKWG
jgi:Peptidase A4 family